MPNFLGTHQTFNEQYGRLISRGQRIEASADDIRNGCEKLKLLHQQVLPFILRREKDQVLKDLPPKTVTVVSVPMSPFQLKIQTKFSSGTMGRRALGHMDELLRAVVPDRSVPSEADRVVDTNKKADSALKGILFLRLLATHPCLVRKGSNDEWYRAMATAEVSGKFLVLKDLLHTMCPHDKSLVAADNDDSLLYCSAGEEADLIGYEEDIEGLLHSNEVLQASSKCLVFAQFKSSLDLLEELLLKTHLSHIRYLRLDGSIPASERTQVAEQFNGDPSIQLMILTTRVGGLGLNLTSADSVVFLESDFNPFADLQAMDRVHRIGQTKAVNVYRLIVDGSIEERILELQKKKTDMSDAIVNTENSSVYSLGTEHLLDIFERQSIAKEYQHIDLDSLVERYAEDYANLMMDKEHDLVGDE